MSNLTARAGIGAGVHFTAVDEEFGFLPDTLEHAVSNLHVLDYRESVSKGVTTGTLGLTGLGAVKALRIEADQSSGKFGIIAASFLDSHGRSLLDLDELKLPHSFTSARAALADFAENFDKHLQDIYAGRNEIRGTSHDDLIRAGRGSDDLFGYSGADEIGGGRGNDSLWGGRGADLLAGGSGSDTFLFKSAAESRSGSRADTIQDFVGGRDKLDLHGIDADRTYAGNQSFDFLGQDAFSHHAGELRLDGGQLRGDTNGDGRADFVVKFGDASHLASLDSHDFLL